MNMPFELYEIPLFSLYSANGFYIMMNVGTTVTEQAKDV
jgi:hypothetical protein